MSFILDALKKSETERQRQTVPGLMDTRVAQGQRRLPMWAVALAALLALNLIVLGVILTHSSTKGETVAAAKSAAVSESLHRIDRSSAVDASPTVGASPPVDRSQPAAEHFSPLDTAPVYAPEIPIPADATPFAPPASPVKTATPHGLRRPDPTLIDEDAQADNQEILPSINEINLTGAQALPDLHLDVHVYATKPAERFVYINMRKYHEGAKLQEGPILERIRRDGVVLNSQGVRFILPRQP